MTQPAFHDLRLELRCLEEFFVAPEVDPFAGLAEEMSGLDRLLNQARPLARVPLRTTLVLPAAAQAPDLEERCRCALRAVLDRRVERNLNDARSLRQEGYATLWRGLVFLALCLIGSRIVGAQDLLPGFVGRFIDEGLVIAGWVALWYPLDVLLYQRWPLARERCLFERFRDMDLKVEFGA